jgi:hypothetical protein
MNYQENKLEAMQFYRDTLENRRFNPLQAFAALHDHLEGMWLQNIESKTAMGIIALYSTPIVFGTNPPTWGEYFEYTIPHLNTTVAYLSEASKAPMDEDTKLMMADAFIALQAPLEQCGKSHLLAGLKVGSIGEPHPTSAP